MTVEKLATHRLKLLDSALELKRTYSIYRSLVFDVPSDESGFAWHLSDGAWYRVATDLLTRLKTALDPRWQACDLPDFNHDSEADYNQDAAVALGAWCLDRSNMAPAGSTQIEPCDIARLREDGTLELIHVKIGTASTTLSHAFNQGANSAVLLRDSEPQAALLGLLNSTADTSAAVLEALRTRRVLVTFAIVTHRPEERRSANLPLFSQISLERQIRTLGRADIDARFVFVRDLTNKSGVSRKDLKATLSS